MSPADLIKINRYDAFANNYRSWLHSSQELFASAEILRREREKAESTLTSSSGKAPIEFLTVWSELMILAFGVECVLKSYWIKSGNSIAKDGRHIPITKPNNHDLVRLSEAVGISLDLNERYVLKILSTICKGIGRYPVSINWQEDELPNEWISTNDDVLERFVRRVKKRIRTKKGQPQISPVGR